MSPLRRSSRLSRKTPVKRKPRTKEESVRVYGTPEHGDWMRSLPCAVCRIEGYSQVAHVRNGGEGRKANHNHTIPLCGPHFLGGVHGTYVMGCHYEFDTNKRTWREKYHTDERASDYAALWLAHINQDGEADVNIYRNEYKGDDQ